MPAAASGLALIRDGNSTRSIETLLHYRGGTLAELWRALRTLKALQTEQAARPSPPWRPRRVLFPRRTKRRLNPRAAGIPAIQADRTIERTPKPIPVQPWLPHRPLPQAGEAAPCVQPIEAGRRGQPAEAAPPSLPTAMVERGGSAASLLAGAALVPLGRRRWP